MTFSEQKFQPFVLIDGDGAAGIVAPSPYLGGRVQQVVQESVQNGPQVGEKY